MTKKNSSWEYCFYSFQEQTQNQNYILTFLKQMTYALITVKTYQISFLQIMISGYFM